MRPSSGQQETPAPEQDVMDLEQRYDAHENANWFDYDPYYDDFDHYDDYDDYGRHDDYEDYYHE